MSAHARAASGLLDPYEVVFAYKELYKLYKCELCMQYSSIFTDFIVYKRATGKHKFDSENDRKLFLRHYKEFIDHCEAEHMNRKDREKHLIKPKEIG